MFQSTLPTHHPKIKIAKIRKIEDKDLITRIDEISRYLYSYAKQEIVDFFIRFGPEFSSTNSMYFLNDRQNTDNVGSKREIPSKLIL